MNEHGFCGIAHPSIEGLFCIRFVSGVKSCSDIGMPHIGVVSDGRKSDLIHWGMPGWDQSNYARLLMAKGREMVTYTFVCEDCQNKFEVKKNRDDDDPQACPNCSGKNTRKVIESVPIIFKGTGFASNDL